MGLFNRLLGLRSTEDFFTEIVAHLFDTSPQTCMDWVKHERLSDAEYDGVHVSTQQALAALEDHETGSRLDILIELYDQQGTDVILIESKIASREGDEQLRRYAQHLERRSDARSKTLLYITRDYDPKDENEIFDGLGDRVSFESRRWHDFYNFLKDQPRTDLTGEILRFMEEQGMAQSNQFTPVDVLALSNVPKALSMMDETMSGEVSAKFEAVTGNLLKSRAGTLSNLQEHGRYLFYSLPQHNWSFWCGLGYYLWWESAADYPALGIWLEVSPKSQDRHQIISAMKEIEERDGWESSELDYSRAWSSVGRESSLQDFLSSDDHVAEIKKFFLESLDELQEIREQYPHLPWGDTTH